MKLWKKVLSLSMALFMVFELLPVSQLQVYAQEASEETVGAYENTTEPQNTAFSSGGANSNSETVNLDTAVAETDVAKIGDTGYATLPEAILAAQDGETVVLLKDVTISGTGITIYNTNLTIDLNGFTLKSNISTDTTYNDVLCTIKNGTLTSQYGYISSGQATDGKTSTLNIENCNIIKNVRYVYCQSGASLNLTNVTTEWACMVTANEGAQNLTVNGGTYEYMFNIIQPGIFHCDDTVLFSSYALNNVKESVGPNKKIVKKDDTYYVVLDATDEECTVENENGNKYVMLQQAIKDAKSGETIKLLKDISESEQLNQDAFIKKSGITIDMNNHSWLGMLKAIGDDSTPITATVKNMLCLNATSTLQHLITVGDGCVFNVENVNQPEGTRLDIQADSDKGQIILNGGTYNGSTFCETSAKVTIKNGEFNGTLGTLSSSELNIEGGIHNGNISIGNGTKLIANGGTYNGGIEGTKSEITINSGNYNLKHIWGYSDSVISIYGGNIKVAQLYTNDTGNANINIYGGTFDLSNTEFYNNCKNIHIYGGTFTAASYDGIKDYVADGYTLSHNANGTYTCSKIPATTYTISFSGNGSTSGTTAVMPDLKRNTNYTLNSNGFKRTGYTFTGWNTQADGKGTTYANKASVKNLASVGQTRTLYAMWKVNTYKITYNLNSGTQNSKNPTSYKVTTSTITLQNPTRKYCTFKGWYSDSAYKNQVKTIAKGSTGSKTLYAKWAWTDYKITYNLNSGKNNSKNPATYRYNTSTITLQNPTRKGYTFKGWYLDSKYKTQVKTINKGSAGNKTLYAKWAINTYKITYKLNGGKQNSKNPATYKVTTSNITLQNPSKRGCTFKGWYLDSKYKTQVKTINKGTTGNKTLYAKWSTNTYKITYNLNGGTQNSKNPATYKVTTATITLQNPARKGYTFKGWYSDSKYKTQVKTINKNSVGNKTLYAKWEINAYKIAYNLNSGKQNSKNPTTYKVTTSTITLQNPSRKGYTFKGWYSDSKYKTQVKTINKGTTGNKTLYAKWAINTYKITYNLNSGKQNSKNPTSYKVTSDTITLQNPSRTGYAFKGWYSDSGYKTQVKTINKGTTGNKALYAKWAGNKYTVIFNGNGNKSGSMKNQTLTYSSTTLIANAYKKTGYTFVGWNTKKDGTGTAFADKAKNITSKANGTVTLYAQWKLTSYKIIYMNMNDLITNNNPATYTMKSQTITLQEPEQGGYDFMGWYSDSEFKTRVTQIKQGSIGNITLYPKWEAMENL